MAKWNVVCWHEDEPIEIRWENGTREECPDHLGAEDWQQLMAIDCMDDCEAAGWVLRDEENVYYNPVNPVDTNPPTRLRDESELPEWWGGDGNSGE